MTKKTIIGEQPQEQIDKWKAKYPSGVFALNVKDDQGNTHITYVRKPDIQAISAAARYVESDPIKSGEILFNTVRLGGSEIVLTDDELRLSVTAQIKTIFKIKQVEIKKL